ncbi:hypothetical protein RM545_01940 [Zunongwangia sp. F260]|uniref:DUF4412 domain-containing protein n=1 Tax=Autumnicola lenta TaxID=3075593 RepID=A0ABU3CGG2_9FLAO|nr:hypothetical protein [Zunongwangia sp. F260]MDT0645437.1 hypothetical protein [Zunongwangia sp. F260]
MKKAKNYLDKFGGTPWNISRRDTSSHFIYTAVNYVFILFFFVACSSTKNQTAKTAEPTKFVFEKSSISSQSGIANLKSKQDSLIEALANPNGEDSTMVKQLKEMPWTDLLTETPETKIYIEVQNDSIWRHREQNGEMIGDYLMIQKDSGILHYYDKSKSVNYRNYDLFSIKDEYEVLENRNDRKEIKGFDCYKLSIIIKDTISDFGNTIYEMYVTDQLALPIHSVINLTKLVPHTFPMEIKISEEKLPGLADKYELIAIEY